MSSAAQPPSAGRRRASRWLLGGLGLPALAGGYGVVAAWQQAHKAPAAPPDDVCRVAPLQPWTPALGADPLAARLPPPEARCPVCGMYPARQPRWACQLIYKDGAAHYFDAALDLLLYLQDPGRHAPGYGRQDIARLYLPDAGSPEPRWLHAAQATLLLDGAWPAAAGAPMRRGALPAFGDAAQARQLQATHGGSLWPWPRLQALAPAQWPPPLLGLGPHH